MKILRPQELARRLSVSTVTLWRMQNRGELPPRIQISSRAVGWLEKDIEDWLSSQRVTSTISEVTNG